MALYLEGLSMRTVEKLLSTTATSVLKWMRAAGVAHVQRPEPELGRTPVVEIDEMWHHVKKACKLWIWKALCRKTDRIIYWECGGRDQKTLKRL